MKTSPLMEAAAQCGIMSARARRHFRAGVRYYQDEQPWTRQEAKEDWRSKNPSLGNSKAFDAGWDWAQQQ